MSILRRLCLVVIVFVFAFADSTEDLAKADESSFKNFNEDLTSPDVNYDNQGWRAVGAAAQSGSSFAEAGEGWKEEGIQAEPPRRRRPGRKRKRRPHLPAGVGGLNGEVLVEQEGVRYKLEDGIQVAYDPSEGERPRQRRPQRMPEDQHWRGEERPQRRRGHRRRQRPYVPSLEMGTPQLIGHTFPIKIDTNLHVNDAPDDYKISPFIDEINHSFANNEQLIQNENVELTTIYGEEAEEQNDGGVDDSDKDDSISNNKSYRRPYSQAKIQETEVNPMGSSSDLKALLKQSGGLSLSEVLQQRNLSLADLLTGKKYALSALKPTTPQDDSNPTQQNDNDPEVLANEKEADENVNNAEGQDAENQRRRLPVVSKDNQQRRRRIKPLVESSTTKSKENSQSEVIRRRLPGTNINKRRQNLKNINKEHNDVELKETTAETNTFVPTHPKKSTSDNLIVRKSEEEEDITETALSKKNYIDDSSDVITTTEEVVTTTLKKEKNVGEVRNRLSLKPRLRLPLIKMAPKRIVNPEIRVKEEQKPIKSKIVENLHQNSTAKKMPIPNQAISISIKDMFGMSDIVSAAKIIAKSKTEKENLTTSTVATTTKSYKTRFTTTTRATTPKPTTLPGKISAKDEILEVLTDKKGGEKLTKTLAERNMTLKELVEHRERGSSQVHLADIFHNASREPDPAEPFLAKSLIEPISREIYPLKALLEGNMRDTSNNLSKQKASADSAPPPMFVDLTKSSQEEESLGIVTLFDKFSEFVGHPKIFDAKDVKKDSEGSSYFTSVISVKPTDEIYRESRSESGFHNSHKQISEIYSSIPTYIKSDNVIEAKVVPDWNIYNKKSSLDPKSHVDKDMDGDGLIVLDDIQRIEQIDNNIAQASNQKADNSFIDQNKYDNEREPNFYTKLPIGVRSAIIVSSSIVGTSLLVFLTIFVACKLRQRKRNLLKYDDSFNTGRVRSPILDGSRKSKKNSSTRSISPILTTGETTYKNQKINTMDSQTQRDAQDYLWDSLRRPFQ